MSSASINPPTPAELEILQLLWPLSDSEAKRLSDVHRMVVEYRQGHHQPEPAITTVSSALRSALAKGLLREVRLVGGTAKPAPATMTRGLVASRSPQTAYQAAVKAEEILQPQITQLIELCPEGERKALLLMLLAAFGVPEDAAKKIEVILRKVE